MLDLDEHIAELFGDLRLSVEDARGCHTLRGHRGGPARVATPGGPPSRAKSARAAWMRAYRARTKCHRADYQAHREKRVAYQRMYDARKKVARWH